MTAAPEFSRPQRIDQIGEADRLVEISADDAERAALAARFDLLGIDRLEASFTLRRDTAGIIARGRVTAAVVQACIATGEPVPATVDEAVLLRFVPEASLDAGPDEEIELSEDDCDIIAYSGGAVDLGEATAETMALTLDPYPRSPNAEAALREAGVKSEEEAGPFGALSQLRDKLKG